MDRLLTVEQAAERFLALVEDDIAQDRWAWPGARAAPGVDAGDPTHDTTTTTWKEAAA
ncbi:MAG: hypothetical protein HY241_04890 [Actinobacteria bacterium]|nr:hypothetical protein [Actinomycetota bacterium]